MTLQTHANPRSSRMPRSADVARYQRTSTYREARRRERREAFQGLMIGAVVIATLFAIIIGGGELARRNDVARGCSAGCSPR